MNALKEKIFYILNHYKGARKEKMKNHPLAKLFTKDIPQLIFKKSELDSEIYKIRGSVGMGGWGFCPWIILSKKKITTKITEGCYIAIFFKEDMSGFYLSLNQGFSPFKKKYGYKEGTKRLNLISEKLRQLIDIQTGDNYLNAFNLGENDLKKGYSTGNIYGKFYSINNLPNDESLIEDIKNIIVIYETLHCQLGDINENYFDIVNNLISTDYNLNEHKEIKFMAILNKINKPYNRIIYGAPGTGKSYKLEHETKKFKKISIEKKLKEENNNDIQYWVGTCGENNFNFDKFKDNNIFAIGWPNLGDPTRFATSKELNRELIKTHPWFGENNRTQNYFKYIKSMKKGDIILIRKGTSLEIHGYAKVIEPYKYDISTIKEYPNTVKVQWINTTSQKLDGYSGKQLTRNTLAYANLEIISILKEAGYLTEEVNLIKKEKSTVTRVTFYDGYTHGQFVGTYKPIPSEDGVTYKYVAGPFIEQLIEAIKNPNENYCLVIEEINRARADKVFGNIFQLLDRDKNGKSQYPVKLSEDQIGYFSDELEDEYVEELEELLNNGLFIPSNLYIWATMNSADQGVYPLDSAFKRRWNFEHIGLDDNESEFKDGNKKLSILYEFKNDSKYTFKAIEWNNFRKVINNTLLENGIQEDRLIAPFFINPNQFIQDKEEYLENIHELETNVYIDKVIMYLFEDVLRHKKKSILFNESFKSFSQLKKAYKDNLIKNQDFSIFDSTILEELRKYKIEEPSDIRDEEAE